MNSHPIKLRAWDKVQKHFVYFEIGVQDGKMWTTPPIYTDHVLEPLEQFSGLLDKNGKEIYEGDVGLLTGAAEGTWEVFYHDSSFELRNDRLSGLAIVGGKELEVIGNIYQDNHLLEKK